MPSVLYKFKFYLSFFVCLFARLFVDIEEQEGHRVGGVCSDVVGMVTELLVHLNVSSDCCLEHENISECATPTTNAPPFPNRIPASQGEPN